MVDVIPDNDKTNNNMDEEEDFMAELTHHMANFLFQDHNDDDDHHSLDFPAGIGFQSQTDHNFEQSRGLTASPQSTLSSPNQSSNSSNTRLCSYDSLIQEQIRAIELARLKQEQGILSPKQKQSKGKGDNGRGWRTRPGSHAQQQGGAGPAMRPVFIGRSGSIGGTGVFLPRTAAAPSESTRGKGWPNVLIPARVVQALQQHFDRTGPAMSGSSPIVGGGYFPPLIPDILVSNRDGMYSLQLRQPRKAPANVQTPE